MKIALAAGCANESSTDTFQVFTARAMSNGEQSASASDMASMYQSGLLWRAAHESEFDRLVLVGVRKGNCKYTHRTDSLRLHNPKDPEKGFHK